MAPENIAIHVAQNAVNFFSSSIAWLAIGAFASQTALSGRGIDPAILAATASNVHSNTVLANPASSFASNGMMVPFMGRDISPAIRMVKPTHLASTEVVKTLPMYKHAASTLTSSKTLGDLSPNQREQFILKHLTNRRDPGQRFISSIQYNSDENLIDDDIKSNRMMMLAEAESRPQQQVQQLPMVRRRPQQQVVQQLPMVRRIRKIVKKISTDPPPS